MPKFTVTSDILDATSGLTAGTKYVVQNQGYGPVRLAVSTSSITTKTPDSLTLATMNDRGASQVEYTHASSKHVVLWAEGGASVVVFVAL